MRNNLVQDRLQEMIDYLIGETENPSTVFNEKRAYTLHILLDVFEYLTDEEKLNPLVEIFE